MTYRWLINTWKDAQYHSLLETWNPNYNEVSSHTSQNGHHQKMYNNKFWRRCGKKATLLHCWWECKLIKPQEQYGDSFKNLEIKPPSVQFSSVQSLSRVRPFETPWITALQASLFITISRSSLRLTSIESVMPSSHRGRPLLLLPAIPPSIRVFSKGV